LKNDGHDIQENIVLKVSMKRIWLKEFFIIIFFIFLVFPEAAGGGETSQRGGEASQRRNYERT
jgi:hypothetical protein